MPENPTTALVKTAQSPALARVSNQLALTDKLLTKRSTSDELKQLFYNEQIKELQEIKTDNAQRLVKLFYRQSANLERLIKLIEKWENQTPALLNTDLSTLKQLVVERETLLQQRKQQLQNNPLTNTLLKTQLE